MNINDFIVAALSQIHDGVINANKIAFEKYSYSYKPFGEAHSIEFEVNGYIRNCQFIIINSNSEIDKDEKEQIFRIKIKVN